MMLCVPRQFTRVIGQCHVLAIRPKLGGDRDRSVPEGTGTGTRSAADGPKC
jgi:hypothetical protein